LFLLNKAKYFFKRELPIDRWQVFQHTAHAGMPGPRFRSQARQRKWVEKLRPISLGVRYDEPPSADFTFPEKTTDVFAAMMLQGTVRSEGIEQLRALAAQGIVVDIPERRLSQEEFYERMSRAWLTWSPEGLGWECFRHYEAPLMGSVPVINTPTVARYHPLRDGEHALYYFPDEPHSLRDTIVSALADKDRLRRMATEARAQVLQYHMLPRPLADAIVRMGLGWDEAPGGVTLN
jgi:glycosyltransferase involved in cell wall biosynthesis